MDSRFTTHAYASIACAECGAKAGERCLSKRNKPMGNEFHKQRKTEWSNTTSQTEVELTREKKND